MSTWEEAEMANKIKVTEIDAENKATDKSGEPVKKVRLFEVGATPEQIRDAIRKRHAELKGEKKA